jgi:hypothetical protein
MMVALSMVLAACSSRPQRDGSLELTADLDSGVRARLTSGIPAMIGWTPARPKSSARLNQAQVLAAVTNNTIGGADASDASQTFFDPDGSFRMRRSTVTEFGKWHVLHEGGICVRASRAEIESCYLLYEEGRFIRAERNDGTPVGRFVVVVGNPRNL